MAEGEEAADSHGGQLGVLDQDVEVLVEVCVVEDEFLGEAEVELLSEL